MSHKPEFEWRYENELYSLGAGTVFDGGTELGFQVKVPHDPTTEAPILAAPGFTDGIHGLNRFTGALAEQGRIAVCLEHPRKDHPEFADDPEGQKAHNIRIVAEEILDLNLVTSPYDVIGHSEGGANSSRFALEHPEMVKTLIVMASGGLIEGDSQFRIMGRVLTNPDMITQWGKRFMRNPVYASRLLLGSLGYVHENPKKAFDEASYISAENIRPRPVVLSKSRDIPTGALQFGSDVIFPLDLVNRSTNYGEIFDLYKVFPDESYGHLAPQDHPRKVGAFAIKMFEELAGMKPVLAEAA